MAARYPGRCVKSLVFHQDFIAAYAYTLLDGRLSHAAIDRLFAPCWRHIARLSRHFDVTVAGGDWLSARLAGFGVRNPIAIPLGVESGRFSPGHRDLSLRRELLARCGVGEDGTLLIAVGRFHPEKRHGVIIDGFARARRARPGLGLVLVGDGLARKSVERAARRALMARIYASADALAHGSGAETFGLVVAEALCSGLPVVIPDSGGASDFAGRGRTEVYATGDGAACARAILRLLERRDPSARACAQPSKAPVGSAGSHFDALFALYQRLLDVQRMARAVD
jgi:alpha-1,6-mannosyltransferase